MEFEPFPKIPRLRREVVITEKIDGTNGCIRIHDIQACGSVPPVAQVGYNAVWVQSRKRFITPGADNFGFAGWVAENAEALVETLGVGDHYGEWWGQGIQRGYDLTEKRFSLFNTSRWENVTPDTSGVPGLHVVPVLATGIWSDDLVEGALRKLAFRGSVAAPKYRDPEGIVVWHEASRGLFKVTLKNDEIAKSVSPTFGQHSYPPYLDDKPHDTTSGICWCRPKGSNEPG